MKVLRTMAAALALGTAALSAGCSAPPASETEGAIRLTYASPYPPSHPFSRADIQWMDWVERESGGRLRFKPFWGGALLSSDQSLIELRHGLADIGLVTPIYARGGAHLLRAQSGFYGGVRSIDEQVEVYRCLVAAFPEFDHEMAGLKVLAIQGGNFPGVLTRSRPVRSLADFRGLRLRAQSDAIDVLRDLGADPVNMPMGEVYSALAKGVIDGVVAPADTIRSMHFSEVASYYTSIRFSRGAYPARAMNEGVWRRLSPDLQTLLKRAERVWEKALASELVAAERVGIDFGKSHGMTFLSFPAEEQRRFDLLSNEHALRQAQALHKLNIDGEPVLAMAQRLIADATRTGHVACDSQKGPS